MTGAAPEVGTLESKALTTAEQSTAVVETSSTAIAAREKAAVEARFVMAINRPRDPDLARQRILKACRRPRFAESARYRKPVGGKSIEGLSVRFAEEVARLWGNIFIQASISFDDRERRIYKVVATDLETNTAQEQDVIVEKFVERRNVKQGDDVISSRLNKQGEKVYLKAATDDEVLNKANAALSKARRNLIHTLIPSDIREEAEETALETVKNQDREDPDGARKRLLDAFYQIGVGADKVKKWMNKPLDGLQPADLQLLRAAYMALKDGEATLEQVDADPAFQHGKTDEKEPAGKGTSALKERVKKKKAKKDADATKDSDDKPQAPDKPRDEPKSAIAQQIADAEKKEEERMRAEEKAEAAKGSK